MKLDQNRRYPYSAIINRPDYSWPNGSKLAIYIGLNLEHFAFGTGLERNWSLGVALALTY